MFQFLSRRRSWAPSRLCRAPGNHLFGSEACVGELNSERVRAAPQDTAIPGAHAPRHAQDELVRDVPDVHPGNFGSAIREIAQDARRAPIAVAAGNHGHRVPLNPVILATLGFHGSFRWSDALDIGEGMKDSLSNKQRSIRGISVFVSDADSVSPTSLTLPARIHGFTRGPASREPRAFRSRKSKQWYR